MKMSQLYPVSINMSVSQFDIETVQYLTDMYFKGVINGKVIVSITAKGTTLLFDNAEDVTYIELDDSVLRDYAESIQHVARKISHHVAGSVWGSIDDHKQYFLNTNLTNQSIASSPAASWNPNTGNP